MKNLKSERYKRNIGLITEEEQSVLMQKAVCVIGCGGLGGGVIENLVRFGVGRITAVDSDVFDPTNLNRQVLSNENNLGRAKAAEAVKQMMQINSEIKITPVEAQLTRENCRQIIAGHDLVIDAVDNIETRLILEAGCEKEKITLLHGAIGGWSGQVGAAEPGDRLISKIYAESMAEGRSLSCEEESLPSGNPSFTAAVVSAMQAAEAVKILLDREDILYNRLLMLDLAEHSYEVIEFSDEK